MNRRIIGLLMGVGVGVGTVTSLVILFLRGEKPRRFVRERFQQMRGVLPEPAQIQQSTQQVAARVSQLAGNAKDTTQQAMQKVKHAGSDLGEKAKQLTPVGKQNER
jgi:gas vesicle protein